MKERELIDIIARLAGEQRPGLLRGIGDDCAVIEGRPGLVQLVTMDTLVESVHFDPDWHPPEKLGRKAVAVNVSDVAAMGGTPSFVLLSLGLPAGFDDQWVDRFLRGFTGSCREYGCLLIGGDTVRSPDRIVITVTVIGEAAADQVVYRSRARPGDTIWVSGSLGRAAAGLELCRAGASQSSDPLLESLVEAHLDPRARTVAGRLLAASGLVHAMIDLSDGLATDLAHLCEESRAGAVVEAEKLPAGPALYRASRLLHLDPVRLMVSGGEDYELLFTAGPAAGGDLLRLAAKAGVSFSPVGVITERSGVWLKRAGPGRDAVGEVRIDYKGFDHFPGPAKR
ncbi:MAG: thiamine-phosphate kinase [Deltaproteobacteria bacterium]|nr:thiamine-phosphate kinase [Deltaproteobacteria bacterium]